MMHMMVLIFYLIKKQNFKMMNAFFISTLQKVFKIIVSLSNQKKTRFGFNFCFSQIALFSREKPLVQNKICS